MYDHVYWTQFEPCGPEYYRRWFEIILKNSLNRLKGGYQIWSKALRRVDDRIGGEMKWIVKQWKREFKDLVERVGGFIGESFTIPDSGRSHTIGSIDFEQPIEKETGALKRERKVWGWLHSGCHGFDGL